jgi:outer membrane receptor protein involved in Fe transport
MKNLSAFALFLSLTAVPLGAQSTGAIVGVVQDSSGAMVPGASITVRNELTSLASNATSDAAGRFTFPRLPVGSYRIEATHQGFRQFVAEGVRLDADQTRHAAVTLEVGQISESVSVRGAVALVETVGGTVKEIVDSKRIVDLPLNGRNPLQLQLLLPGVVNSTGTVSLGQNTALSVNGARGTANNYLLDGGDNNDPLTNTASLVPNPDALEEFSVLTNNFSAEYGRNTGAVINAITKSGTNEFHGSFFEFVRNDKFDARSFFSLVTPKLRRNQFGATFGGPLNVPKLYQGRDRTFFFVSYEGVRQRKGDTFSSLVVPTELERRGDFSLSTRKPNDPATTRPFPDNRIPATRFDPAAARFLDLLVPLPNTATGQHIFNRPELLDTNQILGRVDHSLTGRQRLTLRYFYDWNDQFLTAGLPVLHSSVHFKTSHAVGSHTYTITPALLNTAQFTFSRVDLARGPEPVLDGVTYQTLGIKVVSDTPQYPQNWRGSVSGFWNLGQDNLVAIDRRTWQVTDQISYIRGPHMFKLGGEYRGTMSDRITANLTDPQFTFDGRYAVNPFADFLLGLPARMNQGSLRQNEARAQAFSFFVQDDYKVRPNLTLSLGLRYDPFFPFYDAGDQMSVFRPGQQSQLYPSAPAGLLYAGDPGVSRGGVANDWNNLAPRFGFAWTPFKNNKTSVRGAYGIFFDTPRFYTLTAFANTLPYSFQVQVNQPRSLSDPYAGIVNPFPYKQPSTPEERRNFRYPQLITIGESLDPSLRAAYLQQWNLHLQREAPGQIVLSAGYVGSKGTGLPILRQLNPAVFRPGATSGNIDARRIYAPAFAGIESFDPVGASSYHALQLTFNKRFSRGFTLLANYTFAKSLDNGSLEDGAGWQNPLDLRPEKGRSDFDVPQRFVASFLWEIPSPQGRAYRWVLGGWQTNGILTAQSGGSFTVTSGSDRALTGTGTQRPNLVGNFQLDSGRSRSEQIQRFFDSAAFAVPPLGSFGNAGRNLVTGPGSYNLDLSLFKSFPVREKMRLQFRTEFFNALNHANLSNPVASLSSPSVGRILSTSAPRILQFGLKLVY